jgi:3-oxocholest-4-en-26-oate---CoA ligase
VEFNLADLFESVASRVPDREAVVWGERRRTYHELNARANRLAHGMRGLGIGRADHIGILMYSRPEFLESMIAAYKIRAVPVNVNYRYVAAELAYVFENADLRAVVCEASFAALVEEVAREVRSLQQVIVVDDDPHSHKIPPGVVTIADYDDLLATNSTEQDFDPRSSDDLYIAYTGGTTGRPKGVVWRHEDIYFATMTANADVRRPEDVGRNALTGPQNRLAALSNAGVATPDRFISYALGPLMHVSGHWSAWGVLLAGCTVVLHPDREMHPARVLEVVERERATMLTLVGDAMGRPIVEVLEAEPGRYDTSSLLMLASGGSVLSGDIKDRLFAAIPTVVMLTEAIGSSESPAQALSVITRGSGQAPTLRFTATENTTVFDDAFRPVAPGSGTVGRLATRGRVPLRYYKDEARSARTFVVVDGARWSLPGDMATIEADNSIRLLGRGSMCINTGGEKVYPEEVEATLKAHPRVADALVIGVADARWGQRVAAVVQPVDRSVVPSLSELQAHCRVHLAGYKVPRAIFIVDEVVRSPAGKGDYGWAQGVAETMSLEAHT